MTVRSLWQPVRLPWGASIELSADAPLREPYAAWMQGGLNFHSGKVGVLLGAQSMIDSGVLTL